MVQPMVWLFVLGGMQGAVGWIMVMSGLNPEDTHVSHISLALHFMFALLLLCYTLWFALKLLVPEQARLRHSNLHNLSLGILVVLAVQLVYGAFMAGLKAAPVAATWPDVNGAYWPEHPDTFGATTYSGIKVLTDNPLIVHFIHRSLAYVLVLLIVIWFIKVRRIASANTLRLLQKASLVTLAIVLVQVVLGIVTVLNGHMMTQSRFLRFELFAELHQMVAICLLMSVVLNTYLIRRTL
jgi:heme a synthase